MPEQPIPPGTDELPLDFAQIDPAVTHGPAPPLLAVPRLDRSLEAGGPPAQAAQITLIAGGAVDAATVAGVMATLDSAGHDVIRDERPGLVPAERHVRYFHAADMRAASSLADDIEATLHAYLDYEPSPEEGHIEIVLGTAM